MDDFKKVNGVCGVRMFEGDASLYPIYQVIDPENGGMLIAGKVQENDIIYGGLEVREPIFFDSLQAIDATAKAIRETNIATTGFMLVKGGMLNFEVSDEQCTFIPEDDSESHTLEYDEYDWEYGALPHMNEVLETTAKVDAAVLGAMEAAGPKD